jgi:hypothetical protein
MARVGLELAFPVVEIINHPRLKIHHVWCNQKCLCEIFGSFERLEVIRAVLIKT